MKAQEKPMKPSFKYQNPKSNQTLREALEEHRFHNRDVFNYDNQKENEFFFYPHDTIHVIFGLTTELEDEAISDAWTIFGTDVPLNKFYKFTQMESTKELLKDVGKVKLITVTLKSVPRIIKVIFRSRKMTAKWKWKNYENYMDDRLCEIRESFNIQIV